MFLLCVGCSTLCVRKKTFITFRNLCFTASSARLPPIHSPSLRPPWQYIFPHITWSDTAILEATETRDLIKESMASHCSTEASYMIHCEKAPDRESSYRLTMPLSPAAWQQHSIPVLNTGFLWELYPKHLDCRWLYFILLHKRRHTVFNYFWNKSLKYCNEACKLSNRQM